MNWRKNEPLKFLNGEDITEVNEFAYLSATVSNEGGADKDMENRLSKAKNAFRKLKRVWIFKQFKVKPVLLHGSEIWKTNHDKC